MSRFAEVIVLASSAEEVMEPLTQPDPARKWHGQFADIGHGMFGGWAIEFTRRSNWVGLLEDLESQPWPSPHSVQVLIHDEEDDCFGLWMMHDGRLVEVPLPRTSRYFWRNHYTGEVDPDCPGILMRTDKSDGLPEGD
ncbi:hypothetical protein [Streptomyces shenzhenensis]|uniref:hypothetical protein n=1 Tax=Streptomyces shenzhenensis TaxID=943815 RepID=UPI001F1E4083|nr:hypothetical protein [Streptomyces shenzhenensis]